MTAAVDIEDLCAELRGKGARITRSLRDVLTVLSSGADHLTAGDVLERLRADDPRVQVSTVYRTLERLSAWGVVEHVHLGHGALAYHLRPEPHAHLVCESCGAVLDIPGSLLDPVAATVLQRDGFTLRTGHVALSGWCSDCRPASGQRARSRRSMP